MLLKKSFFGQFWGKKLEGHRKKKICLRKSAPHLQLINGRPLSWLAQVYQEQEKYTALHYDVRHLV